MKTNKIIKFIVASLIVITISSCEDFLTQVNPNEITTDSYWTKLTDTNSGLTAVYNAFRDMDVMGTKYEIPRSDASYPGYGRPNTTNVYYLQMFNASSDGSNKKWEKLYIGIFRANQVIFGLEGIKENMVSEEELLDWQYQMGQARFFRGMFYHYLHSSYNNGSVILYDFLPETEADFNQPVTSAEDIKAFLREDLTYALENLPDTWTDYAGPGEGVSEGTPVNNSNLGRVTAGAAAALLGKSYLFEGDYTTAAMYFKAIIDSGLYRLMDNINDNFTANNEFNQESILEIGYDLSLKVDEGGSSNQGTTNTYANMFSNVGGYRSLYPANWLILAYRNDTPDPVDSRNHVGVDDLGDPIVRKFSLRTSYSIVLIDDEDCEPYYGNEIIADIGAFKNGESAYWKKLTNWETVTSEDDIFDKSGINYRVIRYADILLMYAECLIEGGKNEGGVQGALNYINQVRHRAALILLGGSANGAYASSTYDELVYTAESLMEHLMHKERPMELSGEGYSIRQLDLRRWGITKTRFEELASKDYYLAQYEWINGEGESKKKRGIMTEGVDEDYGTDLSEFTQAAINYREDAHAYWPIPVSETTANSKIN
ncbi:RagB/SusD family nutrient uptake outer membrane protein [Saccharicrinis aurantiacus]|uniref:RagB/SusD family nutrient uptake outer membrane protein n=1 Tax=Saccharicrinis aurantiacus TaxID=1849719 RepID=UPI000838CCEE|nr:RagB/SusD family nutrient uptake outer membrane protein [Saccharicrinis aurantiacus]